MTEQAKPVAMPTTPAMPQQKQDAATPKHEPVKTPDQAGATNAPKTTT